MGLRTLATAAFPFGTADALRVAFGQ